MNSYDHSFKIQVLCQTCGPDSIGAVARRFRIPRQTVQKWRSDEGLMALARQRWATLEAAKTETKDLSESDVVDRAIEEAKIAILQAEVLDDKQVAMRQIKAGLEVLEKSQSMKAAIKKEYDRSKPWN